MSLAEKLIAQLFVAVLDAAPPCLRCGEVQQRWLSDRLGFACECCLLACIRSLLEDGEILEVESSDAWLATVREQVVDLYCLMSLADKQKGQ